MKGKHTMKPHKWAKEIKAWADGAEIEMWYPQYDGWGDCLNPMFDAKQQYRIKPTPKEPQYLYVWAPYDEENEVVLDLREPEGILDDGVYRLAGKIRLEVHDETR
jgi:hypothetical protein